MSPLRRRLQPAFWAIKERNWIAVGLRATQGPYRFVAKRQLDALQALDG